MTFAFCGVGNKRSRTYRGRSKGQDVSHVILLLLVAPAFGIGWLCGLLWANRPAPQRPDLPLELHEQLMAGLRADRLSADGPAGGREDLA